MKEVYLLRHAEKDDKGALTARGEQLAQELANNLPNFAMVLSSEIPRTKQTALLLTGMEPRPDVRAGFYETLQDISDAIFRLANERGVNFLEAAEAYNDGELRPGIESKAGELNRLVDEVLSSLGEDERALIVSHDMTIVPAMAARGQTRESIDYLTGFVINEDGTVTKFTSGV